jgi:hypothetical protein
VADLPKFDALREYVAQKLRPKLAPAINSEVLTPVSTWITKLETWSEARLRELEGAQVTCLTPSRSGWKPRQS